MSRSTPSTLLALLCVVIAGCQSGDDDTVVAADGGVAATPTGETPVVEEHVDQDDIDSGTITLQDIAIHPADANADLLINISEVTSYGAAWKKGDSWPAAPSPRAVTSGSTATTVFPARAPTHQSPVRFMANSASIPAPAGMLA